MTATPGTFDGRTFVGSYENHEGNVSGRGRFELTLNGNRLEGRFQLSVRDAVLKDSLQIFGGEFRALSLRCAS